jgi:hypothetical protein
VGAEGLEPSTLIKSRSPVSDFKAVCHSHPLLNVL